MRSPALNSTTPRVRLVALAAAAALLAGCSSIDSALSGEKIDYRSQANKVAPLEVPPDLTQLAREGRFQPQAGAVSANAYQAGAAAGAAGAAVAAAAPGRETVALQTAGDLKVVRDGDERWLVVSNQTPEQLWPQIRSFWQERGFTIAYENAEAGVLETEWAENRAKIPSDVIRNTIGRVLDSLYSTGERDKFRVRVERVSGGSEIYISHRGLIEVYTGAQKESTMWTGRPSDPSLEADMMARLMVKLGTPESTARAAVAQPTVQAARARVLTGQPGAALQLDDPFDRAWRRVGVALDRSGFTVEDRDRTGGLYFVRYIDPKAEAKAEPGFFTKLLEFGGKEPEAPVSSRYRIAVRGEGDKTVVSVLTSQGAPETTPTGQRIVTLLVDDLK